MHMSVSQGGHSSWKSWKCPGISFCPGNVLDDDPFLAKSPGTFLPQIDCVLRWHIQISQGVL